MKLSNKFIQIFLAGLLTSPIAYASENIVYCSEGSPESFNPQKILSGTGRNATSLTIYNRLLEFEPGTTNVIPSLATSWDISGDKTEYTFKLRKGVQFHQTAYFKPTREFNADDVIFSINRQLDLKHPYHLVGGGAYQYFQGMGMHNLIESVEKVDNYTVKIKLNKPEAPFISNMAMPFMSILSEEYAAQLANLGRKENIDTLPVGTGPFKYRRYLKDSVIRYNAHASYWQGKTAIDNLIFSITPDASVRYQKLKKGECDIAVYPSPADIASIQKNEKLELRELDGLNIGYLAMNTEKPPFNNLSVRRAIAHALDKQSYINAIYLGKAKPAINPYPSTVWSYHEDIDTYEYNPQKARQLLKEAGFDKGFKTTLWTLPVSRPFNPNGRKMGELMQQDLAKVGIEVELVTYDWGTYLDKVKRGEHDIVQLGWTGDNGDPDNFLYTLFSCDSVDRGSNNSRYCQKSFDSLIKTARSESDRKKREALYQKALQIFSHDVPVIPIAHAKVYRALRNTVSGYIMDPFDVDHFYNLEVINK
ncbi:ABC transporter substrate-binding protein [Aliikangiella coralliicola]|uniref:ABC transporter substrate-binding protein n=1 Tax=Aliikangiella coralliicola TaxID=2592383 RepID=A0A545U6B9_9GAMM|nr:ABC transporter substrate-binding protein [Aliikangiella coralliicola]TQV84974.1 ABC transporter substrate-binding protein [Aliikangiella coralliicola]